MVDVERTEGKVALFLLAYARKIPRNPSGIELCRIRFRFLDLTWYIRAFQ
jgi:hypothetical protein